jgi:hypothetical protein
MLESYCGVLGQLPTILRGKISYKPLVYCMVLTYLRTLHPTAGHSLNIWVSHKGSELAPIIIVVDEINALANRSVSRRPDVLLHEDTSFKCLQIHFVVLLSCQPMNTEEIRSGLGSF